MNSGEFAPTARFAIVRARFYEDLAERLTAGALKALDEAGVSKDRIDVHDVPGAFELPSRQRCARIRVDIRE